MIVSRIDPALGIRVLGWRDLHYSEPGRPGEERIRLGEDRPPHVRAASGLAFRAGRLAVIQDDAAFIGMVAGDEVTAVVMPRGARGRRRFEVALGNKHEKLDLESCVAIGDDLYAFGSGSSPMRERVVHVGYGMRIIDAAPLYRRLRDELGGEVNIEGVAVTSKHVELFHRGNTGPGDRAASVRFPRTEFMRWLGAAGALPDPDLPRRYELGEVDGVRYGFTDALAVGERVFYIAAAERSLNALDDGPVLGSQIGVIEVGPSGRRELRAAPLVVDGAALKAEGLAFDPANARRAWVAIDPDDVDVPARLYELELVGPW